MPNVYIHTRHELHPVGKPSIARYYIGLVCTAQVKLEVDLLVTHFM